MEHNVKILIITGDLVIISKWQNAAFKFLQKVLYLFGSYKS